MKNILMIAANPAVSTTLGWPVGFWASELIHPYDAFLKAGHRVAIASPAGTRSPGSSSPRSTDPGKNSWRAESFFRCSTGFGFGTQRIFPKNPFHETSRS